MVMVEGREPPCHVGQHQGCATRQQHPYRMSGACLGAAAMLGGEPRSLPTYMLGSCGSAPRPVSPLANMQRLYCPATSESTCRRCRLFSCLHSGLGGEWGWCPLQYLVLARLCVRQRAASWHLPPPPSGQVVWPGRSRAQHRSSVALTHPAAEKGRG